MVQSEHGSEGTSLGVQLGQRRGLPELNSLCASEQKATMSCTILKVEATLPNV